jgi:hypothetical protein
MAIMAETLHALSGPIDVIADVDLFSKTGPFQYLVEAPGGDWSVIELLWNSVGDVIESRRPWFNADVVVYDIR